ncbi:hypothetical protein CEP80_06115 [Jonesia denitrificans]|nr:hypothetical protein CEP80_06115 [Jonesia denitrificans]
MRDPRYQHTAPHGGGRPHPQRGSNPLDSSTTITPNQTPTPHLLPTREGEEPVGTRKSVASSTRPCLQ